MSYFDPDFNALECEDLDTLRYQIRALATDLTVRGVGLASEPLELAREVYATLLSLKACEERRHVAGARLMEESRKNTEAWQQTHAQLQKIAAALNVPIGLPLERSWAIVNAGQCVRALERLQAHATHLEKSADVSAEECRAWGVTTASLLKYANERTEGTHRYWTNKKEDDGPERLLFNISQALNLPAWQILREIGTEPAA